MNNNTDKEIRNDRKSSLKWILIIIVFEIVLLGVFITYFALQNRSENDFKTGNVEMQTETKKEEQVENQIINDTVSGETLDTMDVEKEQNTGLSIVGKDRIISWDESWQYADYSKIHSSDVTLYKAQVSRKNITVALNAGHGTMGGSSVKTQCHPDGSPKVTSGSTAAGETMAAAVSEGTSMQDGSSERSATLALALVMKEDLLNAGYDVLMIRESEDVQLDNVARTVMANQFADCHIALHYDSTDSDKGLFYIDVPNDTSYRSMEPVASNWQKHHALGEAVLSGMRFKGVRIYGNGSMAIDLTQTSYSTIPSIDLEVGDRASDLSKNSREVLSAGLLEGLNLYFSE